MAMSPCSASRPWNARSRLQGTLRVEVTLQGARPTLLAHGWDAMRFIAWASCLRSSRPTRPAVRRRRVRVPRGTAGGACRRWRCRQCRARLGHGADQPSFRPDRSSEEAVAHVRSVLAPALEDGDTVEVTDLSPAARPGSVIRSLRRWSNGTASRCAPSSAGPMLRSCGAGCPPRISVLATHHRAHPGRICRASVGGRHPRCAARRDHQRRLIVPAARIRACASR